MTSIVLIDERLELTAHEVDPLGGVELVIDHPWGTDDLMRIELNLEQQIKLVEFLQEQIKARVNT